METAIGAAIRPRPEPLPAKLDDWQRKLKARRTLNDLVEDVHRILVEDPNYLRLLDAVYDDEAVEGSLAADNLEAAAMIRDRAVKLGMTELADKKKATIAKALGVVLKRYELSRTERRNTVDGKVVPSTDNNH